MQKVFGPSPLGTGRGPFVTQAAPRAETGALLAFNASAEGLNQQASAEQSHQQPAGHFETDRLTFHSPVTLTISNLL